MSKFECPLDIFVYYLKYPPELVAWLKKQGYQGYNDNYHRALFAKLMKNGR